MNYYEIIGKNLDLFFLTAQTSIAIVVITEDREESGKEKLFNYYHDMSNQKMKNHAPSFKGT